MESSVLILITTNRGLDLCKALPELRHRAGPCEAGRALLLSVSSRAQAPSVPAPLSGRADRWTATLVQRARTTTAAGPSTAPPLRTCFTIPKPGPRISGRCPHHGWHPPPLSAPSDPSVGSPRHHPFPPSDSAASLTDVPRARTNAHAVNLELANVFKAVLIIIDAKTYLLKSFHRN